MIIVANPKISQIILLQERNDTLHKLFYYRNESKKLVKLFDYRGGIKILINYLITEEKLKVYKYFITEMKRMISQIIAL